MVQLSLKSSVTKELPEKKCKSDKTLAARMGDICETFDLLEAEKFFAAEYRHYDIVRKPEDEKADPLSRDFYMTVIRGIFDDLIATERGKPCYVYLTVMFSNGADVVTGFTKLVDRSLWDFLHTKIKNFIQQLSSDYFESKFEVLVLIILKSEPVGEEPRIPIDPYIVELQKSLKENEKHRVVEIVAGLEPWLKRHFIEQQKLLSSGIQNGPSVQQLQKLRSKDLPTNKKFHVRLPLINDWDTKSQCKGELVKDCNCGRLHIFEYAKVTKIGEFFDIDGFTTKQWIIVIDRAFLDAVDNDKMMFACVLLNNLLFSELDAHVSINTRIYLSFFNMLNDTFGCSNFFHQYFAIRPESLAELIRTEPFTHQGPSVEIMVDAFLVEPEVLVDADFYTTKMKPAIDRTSNRLDEYMSLSAMVKNIKQNENDQTKAQPRKETQLKQKVGKEVTSAKETKYKKEKQKVINGLSTMKDINHNQTKYSVMDAKCFRKNSTLAKRSQEQRIPIQNGYDILSKTIKLETPKSKICTFVVNLIKEFLNDILDLKHFISHICYDIVKINGNCYPTRKKKRISIKLKIHGEIMQSITCEESNWSPNVLKNDLFTKDWKKNVKEFLLEVEYRLLN